MEPEQFENILPALHDTPFSQLSPKEFQRLLYNWFEEKGLVSELRSHLRAVMIDQLRNATSKLDNHPKTPFSLPRQAFGLVIAEHLLREGCHYTLSIFSTEVQGVASQIPFSIFDAHHPSRNFRFDEDSLVNVLELLGISKGSSESIRIATLYLKGSDSLLTCLVTSKRVEATLVETEEGGAYLERVLTGLGVPSNLIGQVRRRVQEDVTEGGPPWAELKTKLEEKTEQVKQLVQDQLAQKRDYKRMRGALKETRKKLVRAELKEQNVAARERLIQGKLEEVTRLQRGLEKSLKKEREVCGLKHCGDECRSSERLGKEMARLMVSEREKEVEIERLNAKIGALNKDLQSSRLNIEFLNTCLVRSSQINLVQGEDRSDSNEESSENLTGEVLKQVRSKLFELERESDELDVRFKKLKMNDFVTK